ncbi:RNA polymerase sigma-70 factor (family 1) [Pedobacter africanus]|uniref:RNA polymerase sigma-70 factor (ECF subfamily) n=1 Tax=Pedobacter africanus TaxID=151894 RepID=A0ACC6KR26_9SPHI|nr:RNA polymerase sigma-70 factor [Pedobacter africanus]MDR6781798.1 RNA polymerase sigma-70 factor (ECF subfamily) [Pedobacter africanus]
MQNLNILQDEELLQLLKQEQMAAFEEIYNRYWDKLYAAAYKRLQSKEVSEELVQDLFTSLWINRNVLNIHTSVAGYLFTSVRYLVLGQIQKEMVRASYKESLSLNRIDNSTEETVLLNDLVANLNVAVEQLPVKCKSVFELSRKEFKSNKEIAAELGISEKTVENQLTKALKRLRLGLNSLLLSLSMLMITLF